MDPDQIARVSVVVFTPLLLGAVIVGAWRLRCWLKKRETS